MIRVITVQFDAEHLLQPTSFPYSNAVMVQQILCVAHCGPKKLAGWNNFLGQKCAIAATYCACRDKQIHEKMEDTTNVSHIQQIVRARVFASQFLSEYE